MLDPRVQWQLSRVGSAMIPSSGFLGVLRCRQLRARRRRSNSARSPLRVSHAGPLASGGSWVQPGHSSDWLHCRPAQPGLPRRDLQYRRPASATGPGGRTRRCLQVLLAGWRRWRERLFSRLDGLFALAVRDGDDLVLYRDPSGLCGLYRYHDGGVVAFATDLDVLLRLPGTRSRAWHAVRCTSTCAFWRSLPPTPSSRMWPPSTAGQALHWPERDVAPSSGPDTAPDSPPATPRSFADAVEHARRAPAARRAAPASRMRVTRRHSSAVASIPHCSAPSHQGSVRTSPRSPSASKHVRTTRRRARNALP